MQHTKPILLVLALLMWLGTGHSTAFTEPWAKAGGNLQGTTEVFTNSSNTNTTNNTTTNNNNNNNNRVSWTTYLRSLLPSASNITYVKTNEMADSLKALATKEAVAAVEGQVADHSKTMATKETVAAMEKRLAAAMKENEAVVAEYKAKVTELEITFSDKQAATDKNVVALTMKQAATDGDLATLDKKLGAEVKGLGAEVEGLKKKIHTFKKEVDSKPSTTLVYITFIMSVALLVGISVLGLYRPGLVNVYGQKQAADINDEVQQPPAVAVVPADDKWDGVGAELRKLALKYPPVANARKWVNSVWISAPAPAGP